MYSFMSSFLNTKWKIIFFNKRFTYTYFWKSAWKGWNAPKINELYMANKLNIKKYET